MLRMRVARKYIYQTLNKINASRNKNARIKDYIK